jgi:hypothetical protein
MTVTRRLARDGNWRSIAATTCRPAFSINTDEGMPTSSIVRRSASRICAVFRILITGSLLYSPATGPSAIAVRRLDTPSG